MFPAPPQPSSLVVLQAGVPEKPKKRHARKFHRQIQKPNQQT